MDISEIIPEDMKKWIDDNIHLPESDFMYALEVTFPEPPSLEILRAIDQYKCGNENSGPYLLSEYGNPDGGVGSIHYDNNDDGESLYYIITAKGMYTFDYEVIATPEQIKWANQLSRRRSLFHAFDDFVHNFGVPTNHSTRGIMDIILCNGFSSGLYDIYTLRDNSFLPYERELYPGEPGTVQQLPPNRGGTWYVVTPHPYNNQIFTCDVKHFPTRDGAEEEVARIREEERRLAEEEEREEREYFDAQVEGRYVDDDERWLCGCDDPHEVIPSCGGCVCGCLRGCTVSRHRRAHCEFNDPGEDD